MNFLFVLIALWGWLGVTAHVAHAANEALCGRWA